MAPFRAALALACLAVWPASAQTICEAKWRDTARDRIVPVRIRMPAGAGKVPLILFSHGLGGSLDAGTLWARAWTEDGNAVIHLQHAGSDSGILGGGRLRQAMSAEQLRARALDIRFVIDQVARQPREGACDLTRLDLRRIGMAGHSFGAQTSLVVAGQATPFAQETLADRRVTAAVALSPQPSMTQPDAAAFGGITIPFLSITGTEDALPWLNRVTPEDRERPFRAMAPGDKYLLVLAGANHGVFSGQDRPGVAATPHMRDAVVRATTLFWRATLRGDAAVRAKLAQFGDTLPPDDRFERR